MDVLLQAKSKRPRQWAGALQENDHPPKGTQGAVQPWLLIKGSIQLLLSFENKVAISGLSCERLWH
jgi:hypothetical protein